MTENVNALVSAQSTALVVPLKIENLSAEKLVDLIDLKDIEITNAVVDLETAIAEKLKREKELIDINEAVRQAKFVFRKKKEEKGSLVRRYYEKLRGR